jgi:hypothetical protein
MLKINKIKLALTKVFQKLPLVRVIAIIWLSLAFAAIAVSFHKQALEAAALLGAIGAIAGWFITRD